MNKYGFLWPSTLNCDQYSNEQPCVGVKPAVPTASSNNANSTGEQVVVYRCEQIKQEVTEICHGLPYNMTVMPNLLSHTSQNDTLIQVRFNEQCYFIQYSTLDIN